MKTILLTILALLTVTISSTAQNTTELVPFDVDKLPILKEAFHTERDEFDNVDSPAVWHSPAGAATAGGSHFHLVFVSHP